MNRKFFFSERYARGSVLAVLAAMIVVTSLAVSSTPASASSSQTAVAPQQAAADGHYGSVADLDQSSERAASGVITAGKCRYQQVTDNVHFSGTGWAASGHGWWTKYSGTCPSKANVDVQLQAVWCSGGSCDWRTVDTNSDNVYAGGGSGNRAAVRENCGGSSTVGWRLRVDVDLIGVDDPSGWTSSAGKDLACYPSS